MLSCVYSISSFCLFHVDCGFALMLGVLYIGSTSWWNWSGCDAIIYLAKTNLSNGGTQNSLKATRLRKPKSYSLLIDSRLKWSLFLHHRWMSGKNYHIWRLFNIFQFYHWGMKLIIMWGNQVLYHSFSANSNLVMLSIHWKPNKIGFQAILLWWWKCLVLRPILSLADEINKQSHVSTLATCKCIWILMKQIDFQTQHTHLGHAYACGTIWYKI